jgi:hypothetical protein
MSSNSNNVRLHPWRDGLEHCLRLVEPATTKTAEKSANTIITPTHKTGAATVSSIRNGTFTLSKEKSSSANKGTSSSTTVTTSSMIRSVDISFHETDFRTGISSTKRHKQWMELFEAIGQLPQLESLMVRVILVNNSSSLSFPLSKQGVIPLAALTVALSAAPQVGYLTLIGVPLFADEYDRNGWFEVVRIHPSLHSMVLKDCSFASAFQLEQLRTLSKHQPTAQTKKKLQLEVLNPQIVDPSSLPDDDDDDSSRPWYQAIFSACFFPCM